QRRRPAHSAAPRPRVAPQARSGAHALVQAERSGGGGEGALRLPDRACRHRAFPRRRALRSIPSRAAEAVRPRSRPDGRDVPPAPELLGQVIDRELVARIDLVVLVSPSQAPYFLEFLPEERVRVVLHGVDADFFRPPTTRPDPDRFRCITVGHWLRDWEALGAVASRLVSFRVFELTVGTASETGLDGAA